MRTMLLLPDHDDDDNDDDDDDDDGGVCALTYRCRTRWHCRFAPAWPGDNRPRSSDPWRASAW
jgi:hypothetical protein